MAPTRVRIREVGPRDGFQNEPETIPTDDKVRLIDQLGRTGLKRLEVTSFVRADVIPQLADAEQVLDRIDPPDDVAISVLIPNEKGLENALRRRERFQEINVFLSASETHNRKNVNRSIEESLAGLEAVLARARGESLCCEGVISTSFGCPYEGEVPVKRVMDIAKRAIDAGAWEIAVADTIGVAAPPDVREVVDGVLEIIGESGELVWLRAHFHNTRNTGLANAWAAVEAGVNVLDASLGGIGGCPFAPGATGNIPTEDLGYLLERAGVASGFHLGELIAIVPWIEEQLGAPVPGLLSRAGLFPT
jgi:hydroxymethylglutaryl-CoA lyase